MTEAMKQFLSVRETSERWGVSPDSIKRLMAADQLKSITICSRRLIPLREIERCEQSGVGTPRKRKRELARRKPATAKQ